jgi:hypothetical protein
MLLRGFLTHASQLLLIIINHLIRPYALSSDGQDSSVGIVDRYGLDGPMFISRER